MPVLATASDGVQYVVKFSGASSSSNTLFNEAAGTELYRALRLPTPTWRLACLPAEHSISANIPHSESDAGTTRLQKIGFASQCVSTPDSRMADILSSSAFGRIRHPERFWLAWLTDICASHADDRQAVFLEGSDRRIDPVFIDHGEMFGGADGRIAPLPMACRYLDPRVYPAFTSETYKFVERSLLALDCDALVKRIHSLPADWRTDSAQKSLVATLEHLTQKRVWEDLLQKIALNNPTHRKQDDASYHFNLRASSARVLHSRVPQR